jgi:hypothetical protein
MSAAGKGKTVLIAGLGRFTPAPAVNTVLEKIQIGLKQAHDAGYETTELYLNPEDPKGSVETVREALQSKDFDAFIIGYGLRGMKENTVLFEEVVNSAMEMKGGIKGGMKLLFATAPDGMLEALGRL